MTDRYNFSIRETGGDLLITFNNKADAAQSRTFTGTELNQALKLKRGTLDEASVAPALVDKSRDLTLDELAMGQRRLVAFMFD
jgi:hypothetical protein